MQERTGILAAVGNTPLVKLEKLLDRPKFNLYAKLEFLNPGGSIKDRPATQMLLEALKKGKIDKQTTIVESSSGNLAIGLAQACTYLGLRLICVMDIKSTIANRKIVEAYGATVDLVEDPDRVTGGFLQARIQRVQELLDRTPNSFNCNQYANTDNPLAHHQTMGEIATALGDRVDYLFCATSSCGSLRGCAEYITQRGLKTQIVAVDARGSVVFGDEAKKRLIPGHGASRVPELFQPHLASTHVLISDLECVTGCRRLLNREAIFAGGSSGAIVAAILKFQEKIPADANCAAIFYDRGERYLDTVYSDSWVYEHFGNAACFWSPTAAQRETTVNQST
ncbi:MULTISPECIES: 2,3-diaminopropionate biosynthesis protein SbnA [Spirulina sp. CCY15215]|uniref:2,3-diaminopropionate biosynthesis protein SbnA n=1 Tax=Spirulina sp. CCY15215 TaxID=2767591 RepID=UPI0019527A26|nr:2,3-diaminopropionate biosynthesis protein SbnA [Spirulina major]